MIKHDMEGPYQSKAFNTILADALVKTPILDRGIDMDALMKNLCGDYTVDGRKVTKHVHKTEELSTDQG